MRLQIYAIGTPAPQGSKRAYVLRRGGVPTGRAVVTEQQGGRVRSWRAAVVDAADALPEDQRRRYLPLIGPVAVDVTFLLERPKSHYGSGRNAAVLLPGAPLWPARAPDVDKLARATLDALTDAKAWLDDGQIVDMRAVKIYAPRGERPGAVIVISDPSADYLAGLTAGAQLPSHQRI